MGTAPRRPSTDYERACRRRPPGRRCLRPRAETTPRMAPWPAGNKIHGRAAHQGHHTASVRRVCACKHRHNGSTAPLGHHPCSRPTQPAPQTPTRAATAHGARLVAYICMHMYALGCASQQPRTIFPAAAQVHRCTYRSDQVDAGRHLPVNYVNLRQFWQLRGGIVHGT